MLEDWWKILKFIWCVQDDILAMHGTKCLLISTFLQCHQILRCHQKTHVQDRKCGAWFPSSSPLRKVVVLRAITYSLNDSRRNSLCIYGEPSGCPLLISNPDFGLSEEDSALRKPNPGFTMNQAQAGASVWDLKWHGKSGSLQIWLVLLTELHPRINFLTSECTW